MPEVSVLYGIVLDPDVRNNLRGFGAGNREKVRDAIDELSGEPRPDGHTVSSIGNGTRLFKKPVAGTQPVYVILYTVDDAATKIFIVSIEIKYINA